MIELNEHAMPKGDMFRVIFGAMLWRATKIAFLVIVALAGMFSYNEEMSASILFTLSLLSFILMLVVVYSILVVQFIMFLLSKHANTIQRKRQFSFDSEMMHILLEDGSNSSTKLDHIVASKRSGNYYKLFLNNYQFVPIPVDAFRSQEDREKFETEILGKTFTKNTLFSKKTLVFLALIVLFFVLGRGIGYIVDSIINRSVEMVCQM
ncbi:MAG: YcxB family protein [Thermoguttaceae bacterium]